MVWLWCSRILHTGSIAIAGKLTEWGSGRKETRLTLLKMTLLMYSSDSFKRTISGITTACFCIPTILTCLKYIIRASGERKFRALFLPLKNLVGSVLEYFSTATVVYEADEAARRFRAASSDLRIQNASLQHQVFVDTLNVLPFQNSM